MSTQPQKTKAILLNDTSEWYHYGCQLTSMGLRGLIGERFDLADRVPISALGSIRCKAIPFEDFSFDGLDSFIAANSEFFARIEAVDTVIINGEGSIHGWNGFVQRLFYIIKAARTRFGKNVYIVNHSVYPHDRAELCGSRLEELYQEAYAEASFVAVRDGLSLNILNALGVRCVLGFDCAVLSIDHAQYEGSDLVVFGGAAKFGEHHPDVFVALRRAFSERNLECCFLVGAPAYPAKDDMRLVEAIGKLDRSFPIVEAGSAQEFVKTLGRAKLHVSGRFHYTIVSHAVGTPSITLHSNTPKNEALCTTLNAPLPLGWDSPELSASLVERAEAVSSRDVAGPDLAELQQLARRNLPAGE